MNDRRINIIRAYQLIHKSKNLDTILFLIRSSKGEVIDVRIGYNPILSGISYGEETPNDGVTIDVPIPRNHRLYNSDLYYAAMAQFQKERKIARMGKAIHQIYEYTSPADTELEKMVREWAESVREPAEVDHPSPVPYYPFQKHVLEHMKPDSWSNILTKPVEMPPVIATSPWRIF